MCMYAVETMNGTLLSHYFVIRTPHTRVSRYTYMDSDYTYPEKERAQHREHRDSYTHFIRQRHSQRMWRKKERYIELGTYNHRDHTYYVSCSMIVNTVSQLQSCI